MEQPQEVAYEHAGIMFIKPEFVLRIKSMVIDSFVIVVLLYLAYLVFNTLAIESTILRASAFLLIFSYEPIMVAHSRTIGQRLMKLQVRSHASVLQNDVAQGIGFMRSLIRYIAKVLLGWISLLTIHSDEFGRAIHDKIANSVMVNA